MKRFIIYGMVCMGLYACQEEVHGPLGSGEQPKPIINPRVENYSGKSVIKYNIADDHTTYVVAEYQLGSGESFAVKSSRYKDSIIVQGFGQSGRYPVTLYAVGADEQRSAPVQVDVNPLTPPYIESFEALNVRATFGGVALSTSNIHADDLVIETIVSDDNGAWKVINRHYSTAADIKHAVRGLDAEKQRFGFYIRDRWSNFSDTLFTELTPLVEEWVPLTKTSYIPTNFPGDEWMGNTVGGVVPIGWGLDRMFDGLTNNNAGNFVSFDNTGLPQHFSIFLLGTWTLSRFTIFQKTDNTSAYIHGNPRLFRIWGSMDPNPDGSWDSWTLLGEFEIIKPSGSGTTVTAADRTHALNGHEFEFELGLPPVRYIRFETLQTWRNAQVAIGELTFYGAPED